MEAEPLETNYIQLEGSVETVIYQNPENGYTVLNMHLPDGGETVAVGILPSAVPGERLELSGNWTSHPSYGQQFKFEWAVRKMPDSRDSIYSYLASGGIKGIGPSLARTIVKTFGDSTLDVLENEPGKLTQIKGIGVRKALDIGLSFRKQLGMRRLIEFLASYGMSPRLAPRLYKLYGDEARLVLRDNPYVLTDAAVGGSFEDADRLAMDFGMETDDPKRVEASVLFVLRSNLDNGHCFLPVDKLRDVVCRHIGVEPGPVDEALDFLEECGQTDRCTIAGLDVCYLNALYRAETRVAGRILSMVGASESDRQGVDRLIAQAEREQGIEYAGLQRHAVELAADSRVLVVTGGPGTGKTTIIKGILSVYKSMGLNTALAAPTGRAAKRMTEVCGEDAFTIHRLLEAGWRESSSEAVFKRDEHDPLDCDALILDESSMVDILLMDALLRALRPHCRLVMVGDADQLPSVGPGNVFADIIRSQAVPTVRLTEVFRQAGESTIVRSAHMINRGEIPPLEENKNDFFFLKREDKERAADTIVELCSRRLPQNMGIDPSQIQVLSPTRKYICGTEMLNARLREAVNPPAEGKSELRWGEQIFRLGDRVMQIRNDYDILWQKSDGSASGMGVFNGDIGVIKDIDSRARVITVDFDDRLAMYAFDNLGELEPAYAVTVHKSQGSEYRAVILSASKGASALMTRSVLYTAVTRARELLIIVGDPAVVSAMTLDDRRQKRYSGLKTRLVQGHLDA
ncbi:MAG: ATP-dependent RecD-like DNA helicase [Oscillospiraceae bacterium]|nr:ATP-dependent RecD-like DNA helicase [Oscillospiraceae bacterium]